MQSPRLLSVCALTALSFTIACGDSGDGRTDGDSTSSGGAPSDGSGGMIGNGEASGGNVATGDGDGDGDGNTGTGGSTTSPPTGEAAACAAAVPSFTTPSENESVQWDYGDGEKSAQSEISGIYEYFLPSSEVLTVYATTAELDSVLTLTLETDENPVPVGTYRCSEGFGVVLSGVGSATILGAEAGADCALTLNAAVENGGRVEGAFWALIPEVTFNNAVINPGGCVHGRFALTDKE